MAIIKKFNATGDVKNQPGRGRVYIYPTHREEDGLTGKRISKDHSWRITEVCWGQKVSESLRNYHQMPPTSPQVVWEGCQKKASAVNQQQTKAPTICQMLLGLSMGLGYMVRCDQNRAFCQQTSKVGLA